MKPDKHGWRTIESAPQIHGSCVDLYLPTELSTLEEGFAGRLVDCVWSDKFDPPTWTFSPNGYGSMRKISHATHWRPRPAPPEDIEP